MKAYQCLAWQTPAEFREVPVPEPGPGQVLVKVGGAGVCHSDLHVLEWPEGATRYRLPFTLGHENAGWVEKLGAGATGFQPGDPVIVYGPWGCGRCRSCRAGAENYCLNADPLEAAGGGLGLDGGMAPFLLVPSTRLLVPLGSLDPREAAPLADAALTPYHAVKRALHLLVPGSTAVVIGAGGLGQMGVQLLKALSPARIAAIDVSDEKLALARALGADFALTPGDPAVEAVREATRGRGAELVIDVVGSDATLALAAKIARIQGQLTLLGLGGGVLSFGFFTIPWECSVTTTYWGSITELQEVVALAEARAIRWEVERFSLDEAPVAYERLREGKIRGRAVVTPNG